MEQAHEGKAQVAEEASDEVVAKVGWAAKVSAWAENAYVPIAAIEQPTKEARPVTR
jgi:hypothetical protein